MSRKLIIILIVVVMLALLACGTAGHAGIKTNRTSYSDVDVDDLAEHAHWLETTDGYQGEPVDSLP